MLRRGKATKYRHESSHTGFVRVGIDVPTFDGFPVTATAAKWQKLRPQPIPGVGRVRLAVR
jgi:hypothetical protein